MTGPSATKHSTSETGEIRPIDRASKSAVKYSFAFWMAFGIFLCAMDPAVRDSAVIYMIMFGLLGLMFGVAMIPLFYLYYKLRK